MADANVTMAATNRVVTSVTIHEDNSKLVQLEGGGRHLMTVFATLSDVTLML